MLLKWHRIPRGHTSSLMMINFHGSTNYGKVNCWLPFGMYVCACVSVIPDSFSWFNKLWQSTGCYSSRIHHEFLHTWMPVCCQYQQTRHEHEAMLWSPRFFGQMSSVTVKVTVKPYNSLANALPSWWAFGDNMLVEDPLVTKCHVHKWYSTLCLRQVIDNKIQLLLGTWNAIHHS